VCDPCGGGSPDAGGGDAGQPGDGGTPAEGGSCSLLGQQCGDAGLTCCTGLHCVSNRCELN
jgi:hypothetical protein